MDYLAILKKAFQITIRHKYLWFFGILVGGGFGGYSFSGLNISLPSSSESNQWKQIIPSHLTWSEFLLNYWSMIVALVMIIFIIMAIFWILTIIANGAILGSVKAINESRQNSLILGIKYGWDKFWRVFTTGLIFSLIIFFSLIVLILPIIIFIMAKFWILALLYGILAFLLDLVLWIYLGIVFPYTLRLAVLGDFRAHHAFGETWAFFTKNWKQILIIYLLLWAITIGISMAWLVIVLLIGGLFFGIGYAIFLASSFAAIIFACLAALIFVILMFIFGGMVNTFTSSVLTLTYLELKKN